MARFAIIDAGRVTNIIESDADFAATLGAIDATGAAIGDLWDGETFTTPPTPIPSEANRIAALWQGAYDYEFAQISGVGIGMLVLGVLQSKPKAIAVKAWSQSIWTEYYTRKANGSVDADYAVIGVCPHSMPELMVELGL